MMNYYIYGGLMALFDCPECHGKLKILKSIVETEKILTDGSVYYVCRKQGIDYGIYKISKFAGYPVKVRGTESSKDWPKIFRDE